MAFPIVLLPDLCLVPHTYLVSTGIGGQNTKACEQTSEGTVRQKGFELLTEMHMELDLRQT